MTLEQLDHLPSFALLAQGFSAAEGWTLLTELAPDDHGPLVFVPFEHSVAQAVRFGGRVQRLDALELPARSDLDVRLEAPGYGAGVERIRAAIAQGDVYQVCLTVRAEVREATGPALLAALCTPAVPRFAAWVRLPDGTEFVSGSPELLLEVEGGLARSEPMKGTALPAEAGRLEGSEKDRAELAMITDLVRNDLTPVCRPGSIRVVDPRRLVTLPYALQTVSVVEGVLEEGRTDLDALAALHPGGSVTGAPKQAALTMLSSLEASPRGAYCGVLGWRSEGDARYALLIRTAQREGTGARQWSYGVGSGVVYDSQVAAEWAELAVKLRALSTSMELVGP